MASPKLNLVLISMPWPAFNRPSIQLGSLAAYLKNNETVAVRCFHPYLELARLLGQEIYQWISSEVWVCEALYGALLFPEKRGQCQQIVEYYLQKSNKKGFFSFDLVVNLLEQHLADWLKNIPWEQVQLAGFSICLNQLLLSLTRNISYFLY